MTHGLGSVPVVDLERSSISGDRIIVRDAGGRSLRPALIPASPAEPLRLRVAGGFTVLQRFRIRRDQGRGFVTACRDDNPIHVTGDVVPGGMTAARQILLPEILLRDFVAQRLRIKFRAVTRYGAPIVNRYRFRPRAERAGDAASELQTFEVRIESRQGGVVVAESELIGRYRPSHAGDPCGDPYGDPYGDRAVETLPVIRREPEDRAERAAVATFLGSLDVNADEYLRLAGPAYPRGYLAALPSGEMVRQLSGSGGLLNSLDVNFSAEETLRLHDEFPPCVEIEAPVRKNSSFRKVLTRVFEGVRTYCRGFAMVFSGSA